MADDSKPINLSSQTPSINLIPLMYRGEIVLYDIFEKADSGKDVWVGSRRTMSGCAMFLGFHELAVSFRKVGL